ncbi:MAG: type II secretion system F family protein [Candidatus Kerfeldbacteria bacterium]|nr:type II secretion system F family protein [Candidatus Kerfeldbacteria bacterium]
MPRPPSILPAEASDLPSDEPPANASLMSAAATTTSRANDIPAPRLRDRLNPVPEVLKIFFTQNLRVMIHAGLPLSRALRTLAVQVTHPYFRRVIDAIRLAVESGLPLSKSLARFPHIFPEMYIQMVAAGEASGKLDESFTRLANQLKKRHTLIGRVRNALIYPIIVLIGMVGVSIVMLVFVLPKITEVFEESGGTLPLPTRILIGASSFLLHQWIVTVVVLITLVMLLVAVNRTPAGKRSFHRLALKLPIFGPMVHKLNIANFSRSLSSLLATDIPIVDAFRIIGRTMSNVHYRDATFDAAEQLKTGVTVVRSLERHPDLFPEILTQMISIGEESGTLENVAGEVAAFYEEEVDQTMANLSTIIEPIIILLLGLGVAAIAVAIILPIYSLGSQIS